MAESNRDESARARGGAGSTPGTPRPARPVGPPPVPRGASSVPPTPPTTSPGPKANPARPARPLVPTVRPAAPPSPGPASDGPVAPPTDVEGSAGDAVTNAAAADDDDAVVMPALDRSVFGSAGGRAAREARARAAWRKQLEFRRTLIPILLTCGALAIGFGLTTKVLGPDSVVAAVPGWVTPTLLVMGVVLLSLAGLNMAGVRTMLATAPQRAGPTD